jgi:competence protein ComGD
MKTEKGFTLIESLFVLAVFLIIISVSAVCFKQQYVRMQSEAFLNQLQSDLFFGQQYAISHQHTVSVIFFPDQHYYMLRYTPTSPPFVTRYYSNNITVSPGTLTLFFDLTPSGFASKSGALSIHCGSKHYQLTVLIGKGRFYVVEE